MSAPTQEDFVNLIAGNLQAFVPFAENLGKSRFLVYESEIGAPDEKAGAIAMEQMEMEAIADAFRCEIVQSDNQFSLNFYMEERNPGGFLEIVDAGMGAPLAGGTEGTSRAPDGSTYTSPTPEPRWHEPVPGYEKPGTGVIEEIRTMLRDAFSEFMQEVITRAKAQFMEQLKAYVAGIISGAAGG